MSSDTLAPGMRIEVCSIVAAGLTTIDGRPGNKYEPLPGRRCLNPGPRFPGYICYATAGHAGDHIGYNSPGRYASDARWPNDDDEPRSAETDLYHVTPSYHVTPYRPGGRKIYGLTGQRDLTRPRTYPYAALCICNQCAADPVNLTRMRAEALEKYGGEGRWMRNPYHCDRVWPCTVCQKTPYDC